MRLESILCVVALLGMTLGARAQEEGQSFESVTSAAERRLEKTLAELDALMKRIGEEKVPLSRQLNGLEAELAKARAEHQDAVRLLDTRNLDLSTLNDDIARYENEATYLSDLLGEYQRKFESRAHITELQRYSPVLDAARLATENSRLPKAEVFAAQLTLVEMSLDRLHEAVGGTVFDGTAVDPDGVVNKGTFALIGPAAIFRSADGRTRATAEQLLNTADPAAVAFADAALAGLVDEVIMSGTGDFPLDPTLGDAHRVEALEEPFLEHVQKGGVVMYPIGALAAAALLVALYKWLSLTLLRRPGRRKLAVLLSAIGEKDEEAARHCARTMKGPIGRMLAAGVEHLREPRELIEEVMYETVLKTRLKLQGLLPFIAICAASAPLLGLLGTVTGIITTFQLITVFGSGDVKTLSGGISEALITTKFGLMVAIPSLLLHAYLSRKARGIIGQMETEGVRFLNQVSMAGFASPIESPNSGGIPDPELVRDQVQQIVREMLGPLASEEEEHVDSVAGPLRVGHRPQSGPPEPHGLERAAQKPAG